MAFVNDPNDPANQDDPNNPTGPTKQAAGAGGNATDAGQSAFVGGGTGVGATTTQAANPGDPTSSGSYTNLQNYLSGNQAGEQTMADNLTKDINAKGTTATNSLNNYTAAGQADATNGTANVDQGVLGSIKNGTSAANWTTGDATKGTDVAFATAPTAYSGPQSATAAYTGDADSGHLTGAAQAARTQAGADVGKATDAVGQVSGGYDKLSAYMKNQNPGNSAGENNLDSFVTGASAPGQAAISGAQQNWGGLGDQGTAADATVDSALAKGKATSDATQNTYNNAIAGAKSQSDATAAKYKADQAAESVTGPLQHNIGSQFSVGIAQPTTDTPAAAPGNGQTPGYAAQAGSAVGNYVDAQANNSINAAKNPLAAAKSVATDPWGGAKSTVTGWAANGGKVPFSNLMTKLRSK